MISNPSAEFGRVSGTSAASELELRLAAATELLMGKRTEEGAISVLGLVPPELLRELIDRKRGKSEWNELVILIVVSEQIERLRRQAAELERLAEEFRLEREELTERILLKFERFHDVEDLLHRHDNGSASDEDLRNALLKLGLEPDEQVGCRVQLEEYARAELHDAHALQEEVEELRDRERDAQDEARRLRERADQLELDANLALANDDFEQLRSDCPDEFELETLLQLQIHNNLPKFTR